MVETPGKVESTPPEPRWRYAGLIYLLYFVAAIASVWAMKGLVVSADAAATARNILTHETSYRAGIELALMADGLYVAVVAIFYHLLAPVNRVTSFVAAFIGLVGCAIQIVGDVFQTAPLLTLGGGAGMTLAAAPEMRAMILVFLGLRVQFLKAALLFFAVYCMLLGSLVFRSEFLPRIFGSFLMIAGILWLTPLWPPLTMSLGFLAEFAFMLWLLLKGVDAAKWRDRARQRMRV